MTGLDAEMRRVATPSALPAVAREVGGVPLMEPTPARMSLPGDDSSPVRPSRPAGVRAGLVGNRAPPQLDPRGTPGEDTFRTRAKRQARPNATG
jgi:hypothetical protein